MRVAIMGAGGVGGYFGARLANSGACDVTFVARGAHLEAIRDRGLRVESALGGMHVEDARVTDDPATLGRVDLVIVSVKLWDTEQVGQGIRPMIGPTTAVLSLQNGVQKDDVLRRFVPSDAVMGGVCYIAAAIERPGVIRHTGSMQKLLFGEYDGRRSERATMLLEACTRGGIDVHLSDDIQKAIWEKFVFLVGLSATTATIGQPIGAIRHDPQTRAFLLDVMREVVAVGRAHGVTLPEDYAEERLRFCDGLPEQMTSSMHNDLQHGNRLEVPWLSGGVVELARPVGVPTPLNRAVADILALRVAGQTRG